MMKSIMLAVCCAALAQALPTAAYADSDPMWWEPYEEGAPEADYNTFALTPEQAKMLYASDIHEKCMKHANHRQRFQDACIAKENARIEEQEAYLEKRLSRSYNELVQAIGFYQNGVLERAQEAWRISRWDICKNDPEVVQYHRADWHRFSVGSCTLKELARRVAWIENYRGYANRYDDYGEE